MTKAKSHIPEGLPAAIPQLVVKDAHAMVDFVTKSFGAKVSHLMPGPDGKGVAHGMFHIGNATIFISDANGFTQPTSANTMVYVPDVDASFKTALAAGGKQLAPVADMFWGDRWGMLSDPWGNVWQVATHKETFAPDEMMKLMLDEQKKKR